MTANGSSGDTSGPGGTLARRYSGERLEAWPSGLAELVPVRNRGLRLRPAGHHGERGGVDHHHPGRGALHDARHFLRGQPPVDGVGDDALPRAGAVQLEVGGIVLRQDADALSLADAQG